MSMIRREFESPVAVMNRLMNQVWSDGFAETADTAPAGLLPLDVVEDDTSLTVRASIPGFKPEEIDVQVHNGILSIKAERRQENEEKTGRYLRRELRFGSLARSVALPSMVDEDSCEADLDSGVLTLRIQKSREAQPRRIRIGSQGGKTA